MAKNGKKSLGLDYQGPIHPRVWAVASELNNRLEVLRKKSGSAKNLAGLTALDMRWISKFLETGDPYEATDFAYAKRKMSPATRQTVAEHKQEKPLVKRAINEIMKEDERFSDDKIMQKAADLYYNAESESTSVQMFGHISKIKGWNAPEKAVNVNINKDIGSATDDELLATLDQVIGGEAVNIPGEPEREPESGTDLADELTTGD